MIHLFKNKQNLDEVLFEDRNREYGAYVLRKEYEGNLNKAMASALSALIVFSAVAMLWNKIFSDGNIIPFYKPEPKQDTVMIDLTPLIEQPKTSGQQQAAATDDFSRVRQQDTTNEIVVILPVPSTNLTGTIDSGMPANPAPPCTNCSGSIILTSETLEAGGVEERPEFPGGEEELAKYLGEHIHYPPSAVAQEREGDCEIEFVVDRNGSIVDVRIKKDLGYGLDEEAMRVVKMMPKWKPGKNNGNAVNVRLVLPVNFSLDK